jgi:hypothetical protein
MSFSNKSSLFGQKSPRYSQFSTELTTKDFFTVNTRCVLLVNRIAARRPTFSTAYIELLLLDSCSVLLTYHFIVKSPRYTVHVRLKKRHILYYGDWKVNFVKI